MTCKRYEAFILKVVQKFQLEEDYSGGVSEWNPSALLLYVEYLVPERILIS